MLRPYFCLEQKGPVSAFKKTQGFEKLDFVNIFEIIRADEFFYFIPDSIHAKTKIKMSKLSAKCINFQ